MIKLFVAMFFVLATQSAHAVEDLSCKVPSLNSTLVIHYDTVSEKYTYEFRAKEPGMPGPVEIQKINRESFNTNVTYKRVMYEVGFKQPNNFIYATAYIIESNKDGETGLMVFHGGGGDPAHSSVIAKGYFSGPKHAEKCR